MSEGEGTDRRADIAVALLSIPIFFCGLGDYSAVNGDEAFYQTAAREMARSGEWWRITANGELQLYDVFMNSPVHYWVRAALIVLFGDNYWTMRLLAATFGALTVLATHRLGRRIGGAAAGFLAAIVLLTTFQFVYVHGARTGELDSIVAFVFVVAATRFLRALEDGTSFVVHHLSLLVLLVLKLPVIVMPLAAELAVLVFGGHRRRLREWAFLLVVLAPVFLIWHVAQAIAHFDGARAVVGTMLGEAAGSSGAAGGLLANASFYSSTILAAAYPWALLYLPAAIAFALDRSRFGKGAAIIGAYAAAVVVFYLLVDKHYSWYLIPALPFFSVIVGTWLVRLLAREGGLADIGLAALAVAALPAFDAGWIALNPFARDELDAWLEAPHWRPAVAAAAAVFAIATATIAGKIWRASTVSRVAGATLLALCGIVGAMRVVLPLGMTDTHSAIEELHTRVAERKASEGSIREPISVASRFVRLGWYYFGDDFHVVLCPGTPWRFFVLVDRDLPGPPENRVRCAELEPYAELR